MEKKLETKLLVNNNPIELSAFPEEFIAKTVIGAVSSLKGAEDIRKLELHLEQGNVRIVLNGNDLILTPFPRDIITKTITGLVSSLKGVGKIDSLKISVTAQ